MLKGELIELHATDDSDVDFLFEIINKTDLNLNTSRYWPTSQDEIREEIAHYSGHNYQGCYFIIKTDNKSIGVIKLTSTEWISRSSEVSLFLDPKYRNNGYGKDAILTSLKYAFGTLNLHQVYLHVYENNKIAISCYKKCGFQVDGTIRDCKIVNAEYLSAIRMSILSSEFKHLMKKRNELTYE